MLKTRFDENLLRYRSATGDTWTGKGELPKWLQQAVSAGQSIEHLAINQLSENARGELHRIDRSQDPFAGSRLATAQPDSNGQY
ncbi:H-NS family nucleoid-associated regulatory protein [Paraburkholderia strydomiana]